MVVQALLIVLAIFAIAVYYPLLQVRKKKYWDKESRERTTSYRFMIVCFVVIGVCAFGQIILGVLL